ncbi:uncharacterized protein LOC101899508 [Musca domestica]|uniref:Uncharacterized protein LOC101899508 n=1 Tax=Musca domestica TaxID=7370 RepID=A0A9J7CJE9_MUSDO|nr:uncharacterized protein LOC101899508 [Musca domestica]
MQFNLWKNSAVCLVILLAVLLPSVRGGVKAAPQGRELFKNEDAINLETSKGQVVGKRQLVAKDSETQATNEKDSAVKVNEVKQDLSKEIESVKKTRPSLKSESSNKDQKIPEKPQSSNESSGKQLEKQTKENSAKATVADNKKKASQGSSPGKPSMADQIKKIIKEHSKDQHEPSVEHHKMNHKLRTRQTDDDSSFEEISDDLADALFRQRNDFIAAAGNLESPRPVQAMRANMNSGL